MYQNDFYLTLFSNASAKLCENNTQSKFQNYLNHPLNLEGEWHVGIVDFYHNSINVSGITTDMLFIHCDIVSEQMIADQHARVIRSFPIQTIEEYIQFSNIQYIPLAIRYIDSLSFILTNLDNKQPDFKASKVPTMICLHFKRNI